MTPKTIVKVPIVDATPENIAPYGQIFGDDVATPGLGIPFYKDRVIEGDNVDFIYNGQAVIRTAKIMPGYPPVVWLERHQKMTQLFIGLGGEPFVMVLAPPNTADHPELNQVKAFKFAPGHALLLHLGTWHDFPIACGNPVVVMTANSDEVVKALASMTEPAEMNHGDVYKISLVNRLGCEIHIEA